MLFFYFTFTNRFICGEIDTVLLREPEASFALEGAGKDAHVSLAYSDLWKKVQPGFDELPNAGVVFKGEFLREHPDVAKIFMEELAEAIRWVNTHPQKAAELNYDIMGQTQQAVERFLNRVHFRHKPAGEVKNKILDYVKVLHEEGVLKLKDSTDALEGLFL